MSSSPRTAILRRPGPRSWLAALGVVLLPAPLALGQSAAAVDRLLPEHTLFTMFLDDASGFAGAQGDMPLAKIMSEPEVVAFLEKPKAVMAEAIEKLKAELQKQEGFEDVDLTLEQLMAGRYGRFFVALTHVSMPDPQAGRFLPDIGLVVGIESQQDAPDWLGLFKDMVGKAAAKAGEDLRFEVSSSDGFEYEQMIGGGEMRPPVLLGRSGQLQLFSLSHDSMRGILARAAGSSQEAALAENSHYETARAQLGATDGKSLNLFINAELMIRTGAEGIKFLMQSEGATEHLPLVDSLLEKSGLLALKSIATLDRPEDGVAHTRMFVGVEGEKKGLMACDTGKTVDLAHLSLIPKDIASFSISHLDVAALYDFVMDAIKEVDEEKYNEAQTHIAGFGAQIGGETPLDLRRDIIGRFGTEMIFLQPVSLSAMQPSFLLMLEAHGGGALSQDLAKVLEFATSMGGGGMSVKTSDYKGSTLYQLDFGSEMGPIPVSPCFTEQNGYLVMALSPGDLKRQLRRFEQAGEDITANEQFQRFFAKIPEGRDVLSISYNDVKYAVESVYGTVVMTLPMASAAGGFELPVDLALMPMQETITQHLFASVSYTYPVDGGAIYESYSPIGTEILGLLAGAGVGAGATLLAYKMDEAEEAAAPPPLPERASEEDAQSTVRYDLNSLKACVSLYKLQQGALPERLDQLLEPAEGYPKGFYDKDALPTDPWGNAFLYERTVDGYRLWSAGPNGLDESGTGDDVLPH